MLSRTSSHICGRWYLPMFLFRDGLFLLMYRASLIALFQVLIFSPHYIEVVNDDRVTRDVRVVILF